MGWYALILLIGWGQHITSTSTEFSSKALCEAAAIQAQQAFSDYAVKYVCVKIRD